MLRNLTFLLLLFQSFLFSCNLKQEGKLNSTQPIHDSAQHEYKEYDTSIYLGSVIGKNSSLYLKEHRFEDTAFGLDPITKSNNLLEIRFYNLPAFSTVSYCTILYYDSILKIRRIQHRIVYDTLSNTNSTFNEPIIVKVNADSILNKLVENGIFSLGNSTAQDSLAKAEIKRVEKLGLTDYFQEQLKSYSIPNVKELTKHGLKDGTYVGPVSDGITFGLEFKVGDTYNSIYINNPESYFRHNPDQQTYRRFYEITALMMAGF